MTHHALLQGAPRARARGTGAQARDRSTCRLLVVEVAFFGQLFRSRIKHIHDKSLSLPSARAAVAPVAAAGRARAPSAERSAASWGAAERPPPGKSGPADAQAYFRAVLRQGASQRGHPLGPRRAALRHRLTATMLGAPAAATPARGGAPGPAQDGGDGMQQGASAPESSGSPPGSALEPPHAAGRPPAEPGSEDAAAQHGAALLLQHLAEGGGSPRLPLVRARDARDTIFLPGVAYVTRRLLSSV